MLKNKDMQEVRRNEFKELLFMNDLMFVEHTDFIKADIPDLGEVTYYPKKNRLNIHKGNKWESDGYYFIKLKLVKKTNQDWFNEYQKVEDFMIEKLGDEYVKMDFSKCVSASDSTILIIKKLANL